MLKKFWGAIKHPERVLIFCSRRGWLRWMKDETYLKIVYKAKTGKKLDLNNPEEYNAKLQWLKLYDRKPQYTVYVDKFEVRKYIARVLGEKFLIPILGVWEHFDDINFDELPQKFVLKCTHDSGSVIICKDKSTFNIEQARKKLSRCLKNNGYDFGREWPYKNVKPRIIAEQYMADESGTELKDYKVLCFDGEPKLIQIHRGRFVDHTQDFYDINWQKKDIYQGVALSQNTMEKPEFLEEMLDLSRKLAKDIPHVRVDWYYIDEQLYFGELTFFDASGFDDFEPDEYNKIIGSWITLPKEKE